MRVRETADGEIVNFHCRVDPALSVSAVHDLVDAVERGLRRRFPTIQRVISHAEPRRLGRVRPYSHRESIASPARTYMPHTCVTPRDTSRRHTRPLGIGSIKDQLHYFFRQ